MGKIITQELPHDLPENWTDNQYVTPGGVEAGLTPQHGFNYLMKQVNNAQKAIKELDKNASRSTVDGEANVGQVGEVSSNIRTWFESMGDSEIKNFMLNCNIDGDVLERGRWFIEISRVNESFGTVMATKYPGDPSVGGVMIKACSVYDKSWTSWHPLITECVSPATVE